MNRLLASPSPQLPDELGDGESLCEKFASFFTKSTLFVLLWTEYLLPTLTCTTARTLNNLQQPHLTTSKKRLKQTEIIKKTSSTHIPTLTRLINNTSFERGIVPVPLKKDRVTPILKKHVWTLTSLSTTGLYPTSHLLQR